MPVRSILCLTAALSLLLAGCEPPEPEQVTTPATVDSDTAAPLRPRADSRDMFDGCYYQGQRYSVGGVRAQDGVLKKCVDGGRWQNVDGFGNLIPEDPSVQDTLSVPDSLAPGDTTATATATRPSQPR
jgi:hypothetical protein